MADVTDMRGYIEVLKQMGELREFDGVDLNLEVGALTERAAEKEGAALLFNNFKDYPAGFRVISNVFRTCKRTGPAMGIGAQNGIDFLYEWRKKLAAYKPIPVQQVEGGPVMENQMADDEVDLYKFPTPKWHDLDGGPFIGTGCGVITRDPDSGKINIGTYRVMVQDKNHVSVKMNMGKHGRLAFERARDAGQALPIAITLGQGPAVFLAAQMPLPPDVNEFEFAGYLQGAPVPVARGAVTGLPLPANAEIILEGELPPMKDEEMPKEGPFGEWPGYYTHGGEECVVRVKTILHRNDPILLGNPPLLPITERYGIPLFAARIWDHLEQSGVSDVQGVWCHCHTLMVVVSLKQRFAGQALQALTAVAGMMTGASMYRYYIAVDDDIDPVDLKQVIWAMCTRVDPAESVQILKSWTSDLDPRLPPEKRERGDYTMGRMLIDATKPFHWRDKFAIANKFSADKREEIWEKWAPKLGLK
jgi:UbiD family decarboxylase